MSSDGSEFFASVIHAPDVILIDDLHVLTGSSDVDSDSDYSLAKVFAVLKNVVASIEARKARDCQSTNRNIGQDDKAMSSSVTVVIFSAPLQSRGSSLVNVCQSFFDSIFDVYSWERCIAPRN